MSDLVPQGQVQFASPEWVALLRATLSKLHDEARPYLAGVDFTICETFTDVPPQGGTCVWAAHITADSLRFLDVPLTADYEVSGDYAAILPGAKLIYDGVTPAQLAAQAAHRDQMAAAGRIVSTGDLAAAPRAIRRMLQTMHDILARRTL
jgi:hypothetical protein